LNRCVQKKAKAIATGGLRRGTSGLAPAPVRYFVEVMRAARLRSPCQFK
jgi:hypothetical protein